MTRCSAVVLATPAATHAPLARRLLAAGKHVLVEKPLALSTADAVELATLADERGLVLMVGHTFEFVPGRAPHEASCRHGRDRRRALPALATAEPGPDPERHQRFLVDRAARRVDRQLPARARPEWVSARGARYLQDVEDVIFVTVGYPGGVLAHMHVSWLDPSKTRRTTVVGSQKMLVYDDLDADGRS